MKIVGSFSAMYSFILIGLMTFVNPGWGSCELDYNLGMFWLPSVQEDIYPIHKKLESILTNDTETLFPVETNILPTPNSKNLGK